MAQADIEITIPGYRIINQLGRGGMAVVYLAIQESVERKIALKVMLHALGADPTFSERFLREARIVAQLSHPNIVAVYDVGVHDNNHFIAMEFHEGGELKDRIKTGLALSEVLRITKQMASALDFAHNKGYVHRDIKPENVLFKSTGDIVISDFGIARASNSNTHMTATGSVIGTPHYMSPEQAQGKDLDGRSDLYSLGIVFFEMLCGVVPFKGDSALSVGIKHLRDPIPRLPGQYSMFQTVLDKMIAKDPEDRWQTGADIVKTVEMLELQLGDMAGEVTSQNMAITEDDLGATVITTQVGGKTVSARTMVTPPPSAGAKSAGGGMKWVASIVLLAGLGGAGYYYLNFIKPVTPQPVAAVAPVEKTTTITREVIDPKATEETKKALAEIEAEKQRLADLRKQEELRQQQLDDRRQQDDERKQKQAAEREQQLALKQQREDAKKAEVRQLDQLISQADDYLSPHRLSGGRIEQARESFRKAARINPSDPRVADGDRRVADAYLRLATDLTDKKDYGGAKSLIASGLAIVPQHSRLLDLQAYIEKQEKPTKRRNFGGF
ncbi:MAG: protein kinase [Gammaproteobacteria bacterium]|nr:protein kinase [Gammaproteobacteria bacterium]